MLYALVLRPRRLESPQKNKPAGGTNLGGFPWISMDFMDFHGFPAIRPQKNDACGRPYVRKKLRLRRAYYRDNVKDKRGVGTAAVYPYPLLPVMAVKPRVPGRQSSRYAQCMGI